MFAAISRLTRLTDHTELETLTQDVLADLWQQKEAFFAEPRQGIFIYKRILHHIFIYLKEKGDENRIDFLKNNLPIKKLPPGF